MNTRHRWVVAALAASAALTALATPAMAQVPSPIQQGFEAAWARQPEQRAATLRRDAAAAGMDAAERWTPEPAALELSAKTDRVARNDGAREYEATLAVPLWSPGQRALAKAAASAETQALDARLMAAQWRLAADVREAHWAHQRARIDHELALQRAQGARQLAADVARRVAAGDLARADGHQAESAGAAAEVAVADAAVVLSQTAQRWRALTGLAPVDSAVGEPRPADGITQLHPALREVAARGDVSRSQWALIERQTRANTELTVGAARDRDAFGSRYSQSLVIGVRVPLGTVSTSRSRIAAAHADLLEAEAQRELEAARVTGEIDAARARVVALDAARVAADRRATLARESRGFFDKAFRLGESDLPTRLRIEADTFEAERQAARSRVEADAAISHLRQALGLLPQ